MLFMGGERRERKEEILVPFPGIKFSFPQKKRTTTTMTIMHYVNPRGINVNRSKVAPGAFYVDHN